jgi:hypothetical protein
MEDRNEENKKERKIKRTSKNDRYTTKMEERKWG